MPQETKAKFEPSATPPAPASLQGWNVDLSDEATAMDVLEKAFDFRGDVTITRVSGETVTGYIFDRRRGSGLSDSSVRLLAAASDDKLTIPFADVRRIEFGKDAAHGKSFETWVKKYVEKKLAGEKASIESESVD
jgi:hypothetical protein